MWNLKLWLPIAGGILIIVALLGQVGVVPLSAVPCPGYANGCTAGTGVINPSIDVQFSLKQTNLSVSLTDYSVVATPTSSQGQWTIQFFNVTWGDGQSMHSVVPKSTANHTYSMAGTYIVTETAFATGPTVNSNCIGANGQPATCKTVQTLKGQATRTVTLTTGPAPCTGGCNTASQYSLSVSFNWSAKGQSVWFTPVIYQSNITVQVSNVIFYWGDGTANTTAASILPNNTIFHQFAAPGSYNVRLTASGSPNVPIIQGELGTATTTHTVVVSPTIPNNSGTTVTTSSVPANPAPFTLNPWSAVLGLFGLAVALLPFAKHPLLVTVTILLLVVAAAIGFYTLAGGVL